MGCVSHTRYPAHENRKDEARGRNNYKNNSNRVVRNQDKRNLRIKGKRLKHGITIAEDLTMELREGRESHYHKLD